MLILWIPVYVSVVVLIQLPKKDFFQEFQADFFLSSDKTRTLTDSLE